MVFRAWCEQRAKLSWRIHNQYPYQIIVIVSQIFPKSKKWIGLVITWILVMVQLYTGAPSLLEWHFIKEAGLDNHLPSLCLYMYIYIYIYIYIHISVIEIYCCVCHPCKLIAFIIFSLDIDECAIKTSCHVKASCSNTPGSYKCTCSHGLGGDGYKSCLRKKSCH